MSEFRFTRNLNRKTKEEQEPDYVPKPSIDKKFPGMKKKVYKGSAKVAPVKYRDLIPFEGKPKANLTQFQLKKFNERLKLRDGETREQWEKRTARWRVQSEEEIKRLPATNKLSVVMRRTQKKSIESQNKYLIAKRIPREFDFMKYYATVANFYSIKYGLRKDDMEVGFFFFDNIPFTRERFENACVLGTGTASGKFSRFLKSGYILPVMHRTLKLGQPYKSKATDLYHFNKGFINKLTMIYRVLGKMNTIRMYHEKTITPLNDELREMIYEMNMEILEIQKGKKPKSNFEEE